MNVNILLLFNALYFKGDLALEQEVEQFERPVVFRIVSFTLAVAIVFAPDMCSYLPGQMVLAGFHQRNGACFVFSEPR